MSRARAVQKTESPGFAAQQKAAWLQVLGSGASRFNVAYGFATSVERESIVVANDYQQYLGRAAGSTEIAGWVNSLQHGESSEQVVAAFVASDEFYSGHGSAVDDWVNAAYQAILQRAADPGGFNHWDTYLQNTLVGF